jgi:2-oxoglutarate dehydrogenase E2 component (dihydrolipoamide succinyltransferase)
MSYRSAVLAARLLASHGRVSMRTSNPLLFAVQHAQPRFASTTIKVPSMAESITEGTLKQFMKKPGDYVEADEEIATIETDKVCTQCSG